MGVQWLCALCALFILLGHGHATPWSSREQARGARSIPAVDVFTPGELGFPCIRIPSLVLVDTTLVAFAECRNWTGDGCVPDKYRDSHAHVESHGVYDVYPDAATDVRYVCQKTSTDDGKTWSALRVIVKTLSGQPTAVYVQRDKVLFLQYNDLATGGNFQIASTDRGETWGPPLSLDAQLGSGAKSDVGPGVGIVTSSGRLMFIGHQGPYRHDFVWYSDDNGKHYKVSHTPYGDQFPHMDEAQLVQLNNGSILANMRNNHFTSCDCRGTAVSNDNGTTFGPIVYDHTLISPVCQASILRDTRFSPSPIYFSNPATKSGRFNMTVRQSMDDCQTWRSFQLTTAGSAYSCLALLTDHKSIGLLWETDMEQCTGPSCRTVFSPIPTSVFA